MAKTFLHITTDGSKERFEAELKHELKQLQEKVGGYIESVDIHGLATMYVNEMGLMEPGHRVNMIASELAKTMIVGDVVITGPANPEGETTGLSERMLRMFGG